ncbi:MAG: porin family protein [Proteobacteria bacterium]|nr:porin family protein [Pseudomonadota bacterium]
MSVLISTSNPNEGVPSTGRLNFTAKNWRKFQEVKINGQDDDFDDGDQKYFLIIKSSSASDQRYAALKPERIEITNLDNDTAGLTVSKIKNEKGQKHSFSVKLRSKPRETVQVTATSNYPGNSEIITKSLAFLPDSWDLPQKMYVQKLANREIRKRVITFNAISQSDDPLYSGIRSNPVYLKLGDSKKKERKFTALTGKTGLRRKDRISPVKLTNIKIHRPDILITSRGNVVDEKGKSVKIKLRLATRPIGDVTVFVRSEDQSEGLVTPGEARFDAKNWEKEQTLVVTGKDDSVDDGQQEFILRVWADSPSDGNYKKLPPKFLSFKNQNDDKAAFVLNKNKAQFTEQKKGVVFGLRLNSKPESNVNVLLESSDKKLIRLKKRNYLFTEKNWSSEQKILVSKTYRTDSSPVSDFRISAKITTEDPKYRSLDFPDLTVSKLTKITRSIRIPVVSKLKIPTPAINLRPSLKVGNKKAKQTTTLSPIKTISKKKIKSELLVQLGSKVTFESGKGTDFNISLSRQPLADVVIDLSSSNLSEGKVKPEKVTFTPESWSVPQRVALHGVNDNLADGDQQYWVILKTSSVGDFSYGQLEDKKLSFHNKDDDEAGAYFTLLSGQVTEEGGEAVLKLRLKSKPEKTVSLIITSSDLTEAKVLRPKFTINPDQWNRGVNVTILGMDDKEADGKTSFLISADIKSDDPRFHHARVLPLKMQNLDNDHAHLIINPPSGNTSESGGSIKFFVKLGSRPSGDVKINLSSSDLSEGDTLNPSITFTRNNWNKLQGIRVLGQDDQVKDGFQKYSILLKASSVKDRFYNNLQEGRVEIINLDNDSAGVLFGAPKGYTDEGGAGTQVPVYLSSQPLADVILKIKSQDFLEGRVVKDLFKFTPKNWNKPQLVELIGVDDDIDDGDQFFNIEVLEVQSEDQLYKYVTSVSPPISNQDDDSRGFFFSNKRPVTSEDGTTTRVGVRLTSKPSATVYLNFVSTLETEGVVENGMLEFTPENWNSLQEVSIVGQNDDIVDGGIEYEVVAGDLQSEDEGYRKLLFPKIKVLNNDNDVKTFIISSVKGVTSENGATAYFTLQLVSQPKADIWLDLTSSNLKEGIPLKKRVNIQRENWKNKVRIDLKGVDDFAIDGDKTYKIGVKAGSKKDASYNALPQINVSVTNKDDDFAGIAVNLKKPVAWEREEGTGGETRNIAEFGVKLTARPTSSVVLIFESSDPNQGVLVSEHIAFLDDDWDKEQTIQIQGVDDHIVDKDQLITINSSGAISNDKNYSNLNIKAVEVVIKDEDEAGFIVSEASGPTTEGGVDSSFTIRLTSKPVHPVELSVKSNDLTEGVPRQRKIKFDGENWDINQTVLIEGIDDFTPDDDQKFKILFHSTSSLDPNYHGRVPPSVEFLNMDAMRFSAGMMISTLSPIGDLSSELDDTTGYGLAGGYAISRGLVAGGTVMQFGLVGNTSKMASNKMHDLEYNFDITMFLLGLKYVVFKVPSDIFVNAGIGFFSWDLVTNDLTSGLSNSSNGGDIGFHVGVGIDKMFFRSVLVGYEMSDYLVTGGLGNRQLFSNAISVKYLF